MCVREKNLSQLCLVVSANVSSSILQSSLWPGESLLKNIFKMFLMCRGSQKRQVWIWGVGWFYYFWVRSNGHRSLRTTETKESPRLKGQEANLHFQWQWEREKVQVLSLHVLQHPRKLWSQDRVADGLVVRMEAESQRQLRIVTFFLLLNCIRYIPGSCPPTLSSQRAHRSDSPQLPFLQMTRILPCSSPHILPPSWALILGLPTIYTKIIFTALLQ